MKKILLYTILTIIFIQACKTMPDNTSNSDLDPVEHIKDVQFEFNGFHYEIDRENTEITDQGLHKLNYTLVFSFRNKNNKFTASYEIRDIDDNILVKKEGVSPLQKDGKLQEYVIEDNYTSVFSHSQLKYTLTIEKNDEQRDYEGNFINENFPTLTDFTIGPIISKHVDNKIHVSLSLELIILNCSDITWIRLIPPSYDSYWNIPWVIEDDIIKATGTIYDKNKTSIRNGNYILQINYGEYGNIEKELMIIDFFNNKKGANYGLPVSNLEKEEKNQILLDINLIEKAHTMELWIYSKINDELQKIGTARYNTPVINISKKGLKDSIYDDFGNQVKIKNNKEYYFQVYLYSHEFNGIEYISISDIYPFKIKGFPFLSF